MKNPTIWLVPAAALWVTMAQAACEMPTLVSTIPDGTTATEAELLAAQAEVQAYITAMDAYISCENEELTTSGDDATSRYLYQMSERIEFARGEVDRVAENFNQQVVAFRETRGAPLQANPAAGF